MPKYSVVMPCLLRDPAHKITVESTIESIKENSNDYEFIIVDDGSPLPTGFLKQAADKYIRHEKNQGIAPSWNDGMKAAEGEYVVIINDDIIVPSKELLPVKAPGLIGAIGDATWLDIMAGCFNLSDEIIEGVDESGYPLRKKIGKVGVVGPSQAGPKVEPSLLVDSIGYVHAFFPGYCFMFKRDRWFEWFDEQFTPFNFEDTDMWWRIMKAGLKMYRAPLAIWHAEGDTIHKMEYGRVNTENHKKFIDKWNFDPQPYFYGDKDIYELLKNNEETKNSSEISFSSITSGASLSIGPWEEWR